MSKKQGDKEQENSYIYFIQNTLNYFSANVFDIDQISIVVGIAAGIGILIYLFHTPLKVISTAKMIVSYKLEKYSNSFS